MVSVLVCSWSAYGGGRARALLSLAEYLDTQGLDVTVATGADSWSRDRLATRHAIRPAVDWRTVAWQGGDGKFETVTRLVEDTDPDVVLSWDTLLNGVVRELERPTIGYCRTSVVRGTDEHWSPSRQSAERLGSDAGVEIRPVYPTWYIDSTGSEHHDDDRPIDIMIHGRKARGVVERLNPDYNVLLANRFSYPELRSLYRATSLFLFPHPERFEPLGLMAIEAAAHGCRLAIPENSGVAEIYPEHAYPDPTERVAGVLASDAKPDRPVPASPTDPAERIHALAGG